MRVRCRVTAMLLAVVLGWTLWPTAPALAQDWPQGPVRFILTLGPGSAADIAARLLADRLQQRWGKAVVIDNRPGGDGLVAISAFLAANDDHTLIYAPTGSFTAHPYMYDNRAYDFDRDLMPIARVTNTVLALGIPASMNITSLADFFARARAEPGKFNWAGVPGVTEFVFEGFLKSANISMIKVPYRDIVQAAKDVGEGRVQIMMAAWAILRPHEQSGRLKVLALNSAQPAAMAPGVPTARQAGFPGLEFDGLIGLFGPKRMAAELRERIAVDVIAAASDPKIAERLAASGQVVNPGGPAELAASIKAQNAQVAAIAELIGIKRRP